jgi:hypothetical protein
MSWRLHTGWLLRCFFGFHSPQVAKLSRYVDYLFHAVIYPRHCAPSPAPSRSPRGRLTPVDIASDLDGTVALENPATACASIEHPHYDAHQPGSETDWHATIASISAVSKPRKRIRQWTVRHAYRVRARPPRAPSSRCRYNMLISKADSRLF